jgi:hypothetical protein
MVSHVRGTPGTIFRVRLPVASRPRDARMAEIQG